MMQKALIGQIVLTRYNCQTMRVDDIDFNHSPRSTFDVSQWKFYYVLLHTSLTNFSREISQDWIMVTQFFRSQFVILRFVAVEGALATEIATFLRSQTEWERIRDRKSLQDFPWFKICHSRMYGTLRNCITKSRELIKK